MRIRALCKNACRMGWLNVAATPTDVDTNMEKEVEEWQTVLPKSRKRKVLSKLKGTLSS